jgi:ring-1,2-phenylacetyl-CoA epoxidase subunit PaaD
MDATDVSGSGVVMVRTRVAPYDVVARVVDPEIPVLTIEDLGVLRSVDEADGRVVVRITPTYSGCPAMRQIEDDIVEALEHAGFDEHRIEVVYKPAWSTDWMSDEARRKLTEFGIAPPGEVADVLCPNCRTGSGEVLALFGSTACKALMVCSSCGEPFDHFKEH